MKNKLTSVDEYIAGQPEAVRPVLETVRKAIRGAVPKAEEGIAYGMPEYRLSGAIVIYFGAWKKHFSLYPAVKPADAALRAQVEKHLKSKGTLVFPYSEPVPVKLIARIAKLRAKEAVKRRSAS